MQWSKTTILKSLLLVAALLCGAWWFLEEPSNDFSPQNAPAPAPPSPLRSDLLHVVRELPESNSSSAPATATVNAAASRPWVDCFPELPEFPALPRNEVWHPVTLPNEAEIRECLQTNIAKLEISEIATWMCENTSRGLFFEDAPRNRPNEHAEQAHFLLLTEWLAEGDPAEFLPRVEGIHGECNAYRYTYFYHRCLKQLKEDSPQWYADAVEGISVESCFAEESTELPIRMVGWMIEQGATELRPLLEAGSRGAFGADPDLIRQAIATCLTLQEPGLPRLRYVESLVDAAGLQECSQIGNSLVRALLARQSLVEEDPSQAISIIHRILSRPVFARTAAVQILASKNNPWQEILYEHNWRVLRELAKGMANVPMNPGE